MEKLFLYFLKIEGVMYIGKVLEYLYWKSGLKNWYMVNYDFLKLFKFYILFVCIILLIKRFLGKKLCVFGYNCKLYGI